MMFLDGTNYLATWDPATGDCVATLMDAQGCVE